MILSFGRARTLNSLQLTLLFSVALPLVLLSALTTRLVLVELNASREASLKGDLALIARAIGGSVSEALRQDSRAGLKASLDSVFSLGRVYGVSVYDDEGRRIAAAGATERDMTDSRITRRLSRSGKMQEDYREIDGEEVFSHFSPLFDDHGQAMGFIQLSRRETDFQAALQQLTWAVWAGWVGLALAIITIVLVGHYRSVGRHLGTLVAGLPRIADGDFEQRFAVQGPREVYALSRGLNSMLARLGERERELEQQREEEQSLQRRLADAERLATVGRLARGFAHELGAPLSVIEGRARRIARRAPEAETDLQALRLQVQRVEGLVQDLLDYTGGTPNSHGERFPARTLAENALATVRREGGDAGLCFSLAPGPGADAELRADERRLELALLNILRNARQAAAHSVELAVQCEGAEVQLEVRDDGPGLAEAPEVLLQPFWTSKPSGEGSGLGLAISAAIVEEHGGSLSLRNGSGGAIVTLRLPLAPAPTGAGS